MTPRTESLAVSVARMRAVDEAAIQHVGIPRMLLMEHAGLAVAHAVRRMLPRQSAPIVACCGMGYNGGDGLCAAWHLRHWGYPIRVALVGDVSQLREEPAIYARILKALSVSLQELHDEDAAARFARESSGGGLIIDALLGIGITGPVRPVPAKLIEWMNRQGVPIVAVDIPSGLNADMGLPQGIAVRATTTIAMGLPKQGYYVGQGPAHVGQIIVDDLTIPPHLLSAS